MKKLFCFVAFLFALTSMAIAQLNVISGVETRSEKIKVLRFQYSWLYKTSNGYQIWAKSDNRVDWHYNTIQLGETPEQCLQTLTDLYNIIENQVVALEVQQNDDTLFITTRSQPGIKMAWFRVAGVNAGRSWVSKNQVLSLIDYFNSMDIAQLNVETRPEKIKVLQFQYSWMYKTSNGYQIWAKSDNRVDWYYNTIQLGETPEQCLQTLTDLYNIIENQVDTLEVQQNDDKLFITTCSQMAWFRVVGVNAGRSWVSKNQVLSLIDYFNSMDIAQLNVETRSEKIKVLRFQYSWLYKTSNGYQIRAISDNRVDRHYNTIRLGETPEQCLQTLTDLYNIIENQVDTLEVQQNDDKLFITTCSQMAWFRVVGVNAGRSRVSKNQVLSLIDYFNSMISEETLKTDPQDTIVQVSATVQLE